MSRAFLIAIGLCAGLDAQTYTDPPLLIHLLRGQAGLPYRESQAAINVFGMTAITGPAETWRIEAHDSFDSVEAVSEGIRRVSNGMMPPAGPLALEVLGESRSLIAVYRPGLSYRPDQAIRMLAKARYFYVSVHRVRPGHGSDFSDLLRARREALDDMNLDRPDIAYQVLAGAAQGTYLLLAPLVSLKTLDEGLAKRAYQSESGSKTAAKTAEVELGRTNLLFRVEPGLSYVSDDFAAQWPEFWRPKQ